MGEQPPGITIPYVAIATWVPVIVVVLGALWRLSTKVAILSERVDELGKQTKALADRVDGE